MSGTRPKRAKTLSRDSPPLDLSDNALSAPSPSGSPAPASSSASNGGGAPVTDRALERKERNRLAAQRSRDKKAAEFERVQQECDALRGECEALRARVGELEQSQRDKDDRIAELENALRTERARGERSARGLKDLVDASKALEHKPPPLSLNMG
ncbi:hypothetical protein JCM1841_005382 [Sporobolomyces salmonicolor]